MPAFLACPQLQIAVESFDRLFYLHLYVGQLNPYTMHFLVAVFAEPSKVLQFSLRSVALNHESDRIRDPVWGMRNIRRKKKHFAFSDRNDLTLPILVHDLNKAITLELVKDFLGWINVKIPPFIRPSHYHDH